MTAIFDRYHYRNYISPSCLTINVKPLCIFAAKSSTGRTVLDEKIHKLEMLQEEKRRVQEKLAKMVNNVVLMHVGSSLNGRLYGRQEQHQGQGPHARDVT